MPALTLNGIEIPVAQPTPPRASLERTGRKERTHAGEWGGAYRHVDRAWSITTPPLPRATSRALQGLVAGAGHHWSFDTNEQSDRRLVPALQVGAGAGNGPGSLVGQGKYLFLNATSYTPEIEWQLPLAAEWTVLATIYRFGHQRMMMRSDGAAWLNGTRSDGHPVVRPFSYNALTGRMRVQCWAFGGAAWAASQARAVGSWCIATAPNATQYAFECTQAGVTGASAPTWSSAADGLTTDGTVQWRTRADSGGGTHVGDLAWLPYSLPDAWALPARTYLVSNPWSPLPHLVAGGDLVTGGATVLGVVDGVEPLTIGTGAIYETVRFTLREV